MNILFSPPHCPAWTLVDDKILSGPNAIELSSIANMKHMPPKTRIGSGIIQLFFTDGKNAAFYYSTNQKQEGEKAANYIQSFINGEISVKSAGGTGKQYPLDKSVSMRTSKEMGDFCLRHNYAFNGGNKIYAHFEVIERNLSPNEEVNFCFVSNGVNDRSGHALLGGLMAVVFTNKKMIYAQRRPIMGDYVKTVSYDNINDISSKIGWVFGEIIVDSITEYMDFSVDKPEVEKMRNTVLEIIEEYRAQKSGSKYNTVSAADELKKFKELLDMDIITQDEFNAKKKQLLGL